jgi:hypothetical protein
MTPQRRHELVQRREQLKEQRQRQPLESRRRDFLAALEGAGVSYSLAEDKTLVEWITGRFDVDRWSSIDWRGVKQWRCIASDVSASPELLLRLAADERLGDPEIAVVYADSAFPSLKVQYSELAKHVDSILDVNWQTWVFDPASDWIIEFHHDLGCRWGKAA